MLLQMMLEQALTAVFDLPLNLTCHHFSVGKTDMSVKCTRITGNCEKCLARLKGSSVFARLLMLVRMLTL